jgi:Z1 domain
LRLFTSEAESVSAELIECYLGALAVVEGGPGPIQLRAENEARILGHAVDTSLAALAEYLASVDPNDRLSSRLQHVLGLWDAAKPEAVWTQATSPRTAERRNLAYQLAGLESIADLLDARMPVSESASVVISEEFLPWYPTPGLKQFYWPHYVRYLQEVRGWHPDSIVDLDEATRAVVERLAEPTRTEAFSARGLVVGYVQSGKTANFTGVLARAIDAGYRLAIVLTGTVEILRKQTQRRIDMELTGVENITRGLAPDDPALVGDVEYLDDPDWTRGLWVSHGARPSSLDFPDVIRLTDRSQDYKRLAKGITALEDYKHDKLRPLFDPENLFRSHARVAVVKKNKARLEQLVKDLNAIKPRLAEIPALIIDDESDQASLNTTDPRAWRKGASNRSAINRLISELLGLLPRAQYIGYTATPYANVFVDPTDAQDIFPRDFIVSLKRPPGYMGIDDFHDVDDRPLAARPLATSNQRAHVRNLVGESDDEMADELASAIDAFVLSGAIKLFRETYGPRSADYRHHTMLIHQSVKKSEHARQAQSVQTLWSMGEMLQSEGQARLRALWEADFGPVSRARNEGQPVPDSFEQLKPFIAEAVGRITPAGSAPYIVVNGDKDIAKEEVDFDRRAVWKILIGGAKLSRGFTVEGLTISYYRRRTQQADTLLQMGRWFGFRNGYRDLVRLYIGRNEPTRGGTLDLYVTFEGVVQDEEAFRNELRRYSVWVDGKPQVRPRDIPPLVSQHLPYLRPTARNKMFNAELVVRRSPGVGIEPNAWASDPAKARANYAALAPIAACADRRITLSTGTGGHFEALVGIATHQAVVSSMEGRNWLFPDYWNADLQYFRDALKEGEIVDWVVVMPQQGDETERLQMLPRVGQRLLFKRRRRPERGDVFGYLSESRHRPPVHFIATGDPVVEELQEYRQARRGGLLLYPVFTSEEPPGDDAIEERVILAPYFTAPNTARSDKRTFVQFRVRDPSRVKDPIVDAAE